MGNLKSAFIFLWENLSGIQIGERSKILRLIYFSVLIMGSVWAVMNYLKSEELSEISPDSQIVTRRSRTDTNINKLIERINLVKHQREDGSILAGSMTAMNRRLFNTDIENINGTDNMTLAENGNLNLPEAPVIQEITPPEIEVKAVMLTGRNRLAVINTPNNTGLIVKRGNKLPGGLGRITAINRDSVTLSYEKRNFVYSLSGQGAGAKNTTQANNNNSSRRSLRENMQSRIDIQDLYRTTN